MNKMFRTVSALLAICAAPLAQAGAITDTYIGSKGAGDVIGDQNTYNINGATITRVGNILNITISTVFANKAGAQPTYATAPPAGEPVAGRGIAYGDVLLSDFWNPKKVSAADVNYTSDDNTTTGTQWKWGFSLNDRWNNAGGTFTLYNLSGTNTQNLNTSNDFINCSGCTYREGQAVAVDKTAATVAVAKVGGVNKTGTWAVSDANDTVTFTLDMTGTALLNLGGFAMHWGETCANDVIEGYSRVVPVPGTLPLAALGMGALLFMRRRAARSAA